MEYHMIDKCKLIHALFNLHGWLSILKGFCEEYSVDICAAVGEYLCTVEYWLTRSCKQYIGTT